MIARRAPALARLAVRIRWARADAQYAVGMAWVDFSYWIRPFDDLADRRRWRWEQRTPCGRQVLAEMPDDVWAELEQWVRDLRDQRDDTGRGGVT